MATLSIGILLYQNSLDEVTRCLDALAHPENQALIGEVLIRDQGGDDCATARHWAQLNPQKLPLIFSSGENVGFGAGHNILFAQHSQATSAYICLNPDGILHPQCLSRLVAHAVKHDWQGLFEAAQEPVMPPKFYDPQSGKTEWCSAACLLIPNAVYDRLGGFDERFFMYCEDVDLSWRARALGIDCYVCQDALYYHFIENRASRTALIWQSRLHLAHKWGAQHYQDYAAVTLEGLLQTPMDMIVASLTNFPICTQAQITAVQPNFMVDGLFAKPLWK